MRSTGIIGLGHMGVAIARRLIAAGYPLTVTNRTKSKADSVLQLGAEWADSPALLAEKVDVIITMLSSNEAMAAVTAGKDSLLDGLSTGKIFLEMSTLSPETVVSLAAEVQKKETKMLHCPVLGGPVDVYNGKATIFAGGAKATYQKSLDVLEDISSPVHFVGDFKKAAHMKLAMNIMLTHYFIGVSSSLNFAKAAKLPPYLVHDIISRIAGPIVQKLGEKILNSDEGVTFKSSNFEKDQRYFLEAAEEIGVRLPTIEATQKLAKEALDKGWGDMDFTTLNKLLFTGEKKQD